MKILVTLKDNNQVFVEANTYNELFDILVKYEIVAINDYTMLRFKRWFNDLLHGCIVLTFIKGNIKALHKY